jgi:hypothetical protein
MRYPASSDRAGDLSVIPHRDGNADAGHGGPLAEITRYPSEVRDLADKGFRLLKTDPSRHFKKFGKV